MDPYVSALRHLCETHGGHKGVATLADVNDQTIYQIITGVKLPSGNERGVGPALRKKLSAAFPNWMDEVKRPKNDGSVFKKYSPEDLIFLDDFLSLNDHDREQYRTEIAAKARHTREHLEKVLASMGIVRNGSKA